MPQRFYLSLHNFHLFLTASACVSLMTCLVIPRSTCAAEEEIPAIRVGVSGLETSRSTAFTKELNKTEATEAGARLRVVAAYPFGSSTIESSSSRIPSITAEMKTLGVEIVDSISDLLKRVDCVLLETNDGKLDLSEKSWHVMRSVLVL